MRVATYVGDRKDVITAFEVAAVADEYVITHRGVYEPLAMVEGSRHCFEGRAHHYGSEHHV